MEENTSVKEQKSVEASVPHKHHRDWLGTAIGLAVFLGGVYLLYTVFILAKDMFLVPPRVALGVTPGKPIDVDQTGNSAVSIVLRFFLFHLCFVLKIVWKITQGHKTGYPYKKPPTH